MNNKYDMKNLRYFLIIVFVVAAFEACKEDQRFGISSKDTTVPSKPVIRNIKPLPGGARVFYKLPPEEQLLQVVAEINVKDQVFKFSSSYFKDSLDVYGMSDDKEYSFILYAETRAGNKSAIETLKAKPLVSDIWRVKNSIEVNPGFGAICVDWVNELEKTVNVFVDLEFNYEGKRQVGIVYSTNKTERRIINDLPNVPINVKIRVEDIYGNTTDILTLNGQELLQDFKLNKKLWVLPKTNDSIDYIPACFGDGANGRLERVYDDIIDRQEGMSNYMHCGGKGRTGIGSNNIWNLIIDMGGYYKLSRIITHQRHDMTAGDPRRNLYRGENVGHYRVWYLDETTTGKRARGWNIYGEVIKGEWKEIMDYYIPIPIGLAGIEVAKLGLKGDEAYMVPFPLKPDYTPSARWFRYEGLSGFNTVNGIPYANNDHNCLSEVTLYGIEGEKPEREEPEGE